ncbi:MAG: protein kinase [Kofleriaceae bacterium]|nr:protein kinase [Kofleriaceae bacterium]
MEQFGKYTLLRKIGTGGMAEVFLARTAVAQGLAKTLVIKKIHPAYARSRQFVAMFVDEAKIALGLNHPSIVQVFDFGAVGDTYFLAMELVEGLDLLRLLQAGAAQKRRVPHGLAAYVVQQVAKGLDYAHRKADEFGEPLGIVHRDISPQNILLSWDGSVKIVDFGIARARDVHEDEGVIKGKFAYMSPEQARGEPVDPRSDVFSAGIVLYELVCARPLFPGKGKEALELVKAGAIPRPRDFAPDISDALERTILRALAFHKDDRFQTARDLQNELGRFQLDYSRTSGELVDSGALAQFLSTVVPAEQRAPIRVPIAPAAADSEPASIRGLSSGSLALPGDGGDGGEPRTSTGRDAREVRERKYVFVVEGVIRGLPDLERRLGADGARRVVDAFLEVARDVAYKLDALVDTPRGGTRSGLVGGDGEPRDALRLVVGLPIAAEDDATRVIRLALALVDALDGIGSDVEPELRLAVGIQRGVAVVTRTARRGARLEYELEASTTGFAERLARQARGAEILVGGRVFRAARADWTFEALAAIDLPTEDTASGPPTDDDTQPGTRRARVYRLRGPKERAQRLRERARADAKRLIGRELELKALRDVYRDVLVTRRKRHVLLVGDTGVGKRTLVTSFLAAVPRDEAIVIRTSTRVGTAMTPYGVIADLARDVLGLAEGAEPHEVQRRMERALPLIFAGEEDSREARGAMVALGLLLGVRPPGGEDIDAEERRQRILQLTLRVEQRLQVDKPLIVIGEDVHWCDQETLELFLELLKVPTGRPIFGLVTSRPDRRVLEAARVAGAEMIHLDELDADARVRLVTDRFVPGHDVDDLATQVVARAGGNPFFINEMLDALIERGIVVAEPDDADHPGLLRWVKRDAGVPTPSSIEDLLATRFDRLPADEKATLLAAAVLGRMVAVPAVAALLGRPARYELDELVKRGLLAVAEGDHYRFKNDMTMTVAYGLVPADERTRLHRIAAARIAGAAGYRAGQDDAVIARHLELAGDAVAAADRYLRAAAHAIDVGGNADAYRQLARALKLLPADDHARRFAAHRQRSEIMQRLARRPQQLRELHQMRKEAESLGDPRKQAAAHAALAQFYIDVGKAPAAARAVAPALQLARDAGDRLAEADALRLRSSIARLAGNNEESLRLGEQALALCGDGNGGERDALSARALILNNLGTTLWNMGRLEAAIEHYAEALIIYRALGMPRLEARALNNMGIVFAALGEFEEALAHYKSSLKIDQQLGDRSGISLKLGNIGQAYADVGDVARADSYLAKAIKLAEQSGDNSTLCDAVISHGQAKLVRGDSRAGLALLERGLELATANRERYQEIRALEYIAFGQLQAGDPPGGALELARSATELARRMPMIIGVIYGLAAQGLAQSRLGDHAAAIAATGEAVALQDAQTRPEGAEHILCWHARVLAAAGRRDDAVAAARRAQAEVDVKLSRLQDEELRRIYLGSRTPAEIRAILGT